MWRHCSRQANKTDSPWICILFVQCACVCILCSVGAWEWRPEEDDERLPYTCSLAHDRPSCHQGLPWTGAPCFLDWPLSVNHHPLPQGWVAHSHHCTGVYGSCCPVIFSTGLFSQADRYFKVLMDSYFSKLGNGESSNTKGRIQHSRYLRGNPRNAVGAEGYRVASHGPCPLRLQYWGNNID